MDSERESHAAINSLTQVNDGLGTRNFSMEHRCIDVFFFFNFKKKILAQYENITLSLGISLEMVQKSAI